MAVLNAFVAFLLRAFGHGLGPRVVTTGPFGTKRKSPRVRTAALEMVFNHDTGRMEGRCLKGRFAGRELSSLSESELLQLRSELRSTDSQGAVLMEAFLDKRSRGWAPPKN